MAVQIFIPKIRMTLFENLYIPNINVLNPLVESKNIKIKSKVSVKIVWPRIILAMKIRKIDVVLFVKQSIGDSNK